MSLPKPIEEKLGGAPDGKMSVRLELRLLTCGALIERRISAALREQFGTTLPRFDFLAALQRGGELTLGEVSRLLMVSNGNITVLANRLRQDGLVEDAAGRGDRRAQYVRLTAEGARQFARMAATNERWVEQLFADLQPSEKEELLRLLDLAKHSLQRSQMEIAR